MKKKMFTMCLVGILTLATASSSFALSNFTDIKSGNWAEPYVNKLVEKGGINGYPDGTFKPSSTMTTAEFIKTIMAIIGDGEYQPIEGDKHWASGYMHYAGVLGIVPEGMFEKSDWDKPITREKMGVIMEKVAEVFYEEETLADSAKLASVKTGIKDYSSICDYCKDYIIQAVNRGLIQGYADGTFGPKKTATRAEAATMIVRLTEPTYRTVEVKTEAVKEGTNLADILPQALRDKGVGSFAKDYVVLENGNQFNLKYLYSNDENFYVEYKISGKVYTLDKNMGAIDVSSPTNDWGTEANPAVQKQAFNGKLAETAYFIFEAWHDNDNNSTIYLVPNTLTE
ncbi:S-layer homology domain-containing protein [Aminipila butyrica]|uniref:S-layer homology domain-containing protein n=1 Tax=Aminipila butyrica TaxID=433296 RepID=A0A858BXE7_9FIRM|nr:S-layer homology domain-containing protein [Aminipila butyrica]QIB69755.1 S-layer homology domain-containing protein [Aminipila butyrica]